MHAQHKQLRGQCKNGIILFKKLLRVHSQVVDITSILAATILTIKPVLCPFHHNRKPFIFQWAFTLRNAGIGSGFIPAFRSVNAH